MGSRAKHALLIVDVQYDFLPDGGSLAVAGGKEIIPVIEQLLDTSAGWPWSKVVASQDYHPRGHVSFATSHVGYEDKPFTEIEVTGRTGKQRIKQMLWPEHCIQGTKGCQIEETVERALNAWRDMDRFFLVQKGADPAVDAYSAFATPTSPSPPSAQGSAASLDTRQASASDSTESSPLTTYLRKHKITHLVICGIATDVCVRATANDAISEGFEVVLVRNACRGVDHDNSERTLLELAKRRGASVVQDVAELRRWLPLQD